VAPRHRSRYWPAVSAALILIVVSAPNSQKSSPSSSRSPYPSFVRLLDVVVDVKPSFVAGANALSPSLSAGQRGRTVSLAPPSCRSSRKGERRAEGLPYLTGIPLSSQKENSYLGRRSRRSTALGIVRAFIAASQHARGEGHDRYKPRHEAEGCRQR
jgi:hypothetical protein